jgi:DNA modification methylase
MTDLNLYGTDLFGNPIEPTRPSVLAERFFIPPFSVLNAREGWWQDRKRGWIGMGIKSEVGRDAVTYNIGDMAEFQETASLRSNTVSSSNAMKYAGGYENSDPGTAGTSIFDPTLTELCYRWFCPKGGQIVDPFAGGSVRGIVAASLGMQYWGCDLREEQIAANREQAAAILPTDQQPQWVCGDSMVKLADAPAADFVFSCPPYGDLEKYSDDPRDLSSMDYHAFIGAYRRIILAACARLKPNRFACFVVGDFRDSKGYYRNFPADTISSFLQCGMQLYNEAILVTQVGSLPIRVAKQWETSRKLGKTHQNVFVFVKGDARVATKAIEE